MNTVAPSNKLVVYRVLEVFEGAFRVVSVSLFHRRGAVVFLLVQFSFNASEYLMELNK